jgi:hypothetical protein
MIQSRLKAANQYSYPTPWPGHTSRPGSNQPASRPCADFPFASGLSSVGSFLWSIFIQSLQGHPVRSEIELYRYATNRHYGCATECERDRSRSSVLIFVESRFGARRIPGCLQAARQPIASRCRHRVRTRGTGGSNHCEEEGRLVRRGIRHAQAGSARGVLARPNDAYQSARVELSGSAGAELSPTDGDRYRGCTSVLSGDVIESDRLRARELPPIA